MIQKRSLSVITAASISIKYSKAGRHGASPLPDGFKVHLVINEKGEILDFDLTPGNVVDNNHSLQKRILGKVKGLCFGDKGYSTALWKDFIQQGLKIITKSKSKAKAKLMLLNERYMLLKRPLIESVNDILLPSLIWSIPDTEIPIML